MNVLIINAAKNYIVEMIFVIPLAEKTALIVLQIAIVILLIVVIQVLLTPIFQAAFLLVIWFLQAISVAAAQNITVIAVLILIARQAMNVLAIPVLKLLIAGTALAIAVKLAVVVQLIVETA